MKRTRNWNFHYLGLGGLCLCLIPTLTKAAEGDVAGEMPEAEQLLEEAASGASGTVLWWEQFQDSTLSDLIGLALAQNKDALSALESIEESRALFGVEKSSLYPSLSASIGDQRSRTKNEVTGDKSSSEGGSASLDASWEIDLFGKNRSSRKATAADLSQSIESYYNVQASLAAEVATNYLQLRSYQEAMRILMRNKETREESLDIARWKEEAGTGSSLDTQQARSSLELVNASIPETRRNIQATMNSLSYLCGLYPGELDEMLVSSGGVPELKDDLSVGIPANALRQRPDVRAAAQSVMAAAYRTKAAKKNRYPSLNLSGSIGVDAANAGKLFDPQYTIASAVGSLTAPIFQGGSLKRQYEAAGSREKQAILSYEATVLSALSEVENAVYAINMKREQIESLVEALDAARQTSALADLQYESGQVDFITVLDAERTLLSVEEQHLNAVYDLGAAQVQLYKALGGGWVAL